MNLLEPTYMSDIMPPSQPRQHAISGIDHFMNSEMVCDTACCKCGKSSCECCDGDTNIVEEGVDVVIGLGAVGVALAVGAFVGYTNYRISQKQMIENILDDVPKFIAQFRDTKRDCVTFGNYLKSSVLNKARMSNTEFKIMGDIESFEETFLSLDIANKDVNNYSEKGISLDGLNELFIKFAFFGKYQPLYIILYVLMYETYLELNKELQPLPFVSQFILNSHRFRYKEQITKYCNKYGYKKESEDELITPEYIKRITENVNNMKNI